MFIFISEDCSCRFFTNMVIETKTVSLNAQLEPCSSQITVASNALIFALQISPHVLLSLMKQHTTFIKKKNNIHRHVKDVRKRRLVLIDSTQRFRVSLSKHSQSISIKNLKNLGSNASRLTQVMIVQQKWNSQTQLISFA